MTARCTDGKAHVWDLTAHDLSDWTVRCRYCNATIAARALFDEIARRVYDAPEQLERDCGE